MTDPTIIDARRLNARLASSDELALIDVREQGAYSQAHLLFAVSIPVSRLELRIPRLVPRLSAPVVICDGGENNNAWARRAAACLAALGYSDVQILSGGPTDWQRSGAEIYSGVNVPSKAFGEFVETWHDTPRMPADQVQKLIDSGTDMVILDSRPMPEFQRMSIPGGVDCPGAELVYRVHEMAPDPNTTIVVNCAGRTRSIIGAQSLINAGVPNKIVALKDGTMGWELAGLSVARGCTDHAPGPGEQALALARQRAANVARRFGVNSIDASTVQRWLGDAGRTTMLLDVRTEQEFLDGHWPGAEHAPGGQLVQATDEFIGTRNARIVLCDGADGVRATMTAHWLIQLGWPDVSVLNQLPEQPETGWPEPVVMAVATTETGPQASSQSSAEAAGPLQFAEQVSITDLQAELDQMVPPTVVDLSSSLQYRRGHIAGAYWTVRSRLPDNLSALPPDRPLVLMATNPYLAHLAAADLRAAGRSDVRVLDGDIEQWRSAGGVVEQGMQSPLCDDDDVWFKPYDHAGDQARRMQEYLTWEVGLVDQVNREGLARFKRF